MYSTHIEGKSVVEERFIRTLKNRNRTIKMKPIDVKDNTYINIGKEVNDQDRTFKVGDRVRISNYKSIFGKGYTPNWSEEILRLKKLKIQFHGHMLLMILMVKYLLEHFVKKNYKK